MTRRYFVAGVLGAVGMFIWSFAAHMFLSLGELGVSQIPSQDPVVAALSSSLGNEHGLYFYPGAGSNKHPTREEQAEAMKQMPELLAKFPTGILIYHPAGTPFNFPKALAGEFAIELLEVMLAVYLLSKARSASFGCRVGFFTMVGLIAAIWTNLSYWNWYGFPGNYTAGYMTTQIAGFMVAGIIAGLVLPKAETN